MSAAKKFSKFLKRERNEAANAYVSGKPEKVTALSPSRGDATFFGPGGGIVSGAAQVNSTNTRGAKGFAGPGKSKFLIVQSDASGDLAFWSGFQTASVTLKGKPGKVAMKLRVTEVFRKQKGGWKLIHRHADNLAKPAKTGK